MIILIIIWSIKIEKHSTSLKAHTKWWFVNKLLPSSPHHLKIYQDNSPQGTYTTKYQKKKSFKTKVMILNTCNQLYHLDTMQYVLLAANVTVTVSW